MSTTPGFETLKRLHPHIRSPFIVGAPVRPYAQHQLAAAVTQSGGLGFLSSTPSDRSELTAASALFAYSSSSSPPPAGPPTQDGILPLGIGYLLWMTDLSRAISDIATAKISAVWLYAWNDIAHLREWIHTLRANCPWTALYIQVLNVTETLAVLDDACSGDVANVVLIVQGTDAGGHGAARGSASLMTLLPEVRRVLRTRGTEKAKGKGEGEGKGKGEGYGDIPLLAAGGIVDGTTAFAALALGASGVVLGTRLLASTESTAPAGFKRHILRAKDGGVSTKRTRLFDTLRGTGDFPGAYDGRALWNRSLEEERRGEEEGVLRGRYEGAVRRWEEREKSENGDANGEGEEERERREETWGETGRLTEYAGTGVGLIDSVEDAREIVRAVREGIQERMKQVNAELQEDEEGYGTRRRSSETRHRDSKL